MAKIVDRFPDGEGVKYPWDEWQKRTEQGEYPAWEAVKGDDFDTDTRTFVHVLHNRAKYNGLKVRTKTGTNRKGREVVWFQFYVEAGGDE